LPRSIVSAAEQVGEQYGAAGFCLASAGRSGTAGAFTVCQLPGEFVGPVVQPTRSSTGTIGISLHASKLLAGLFSDRINFTLSALFFCPGLSLPLCQRGGVACITLRPLFTLVLIGITVTGAVTPVAKTPYSSSGQHKTNDHFPA